MTMGMKLKELRNGKKLSQEQVAEQVGVSRQAVSKWETGQSDPSTENLICLAHLFGVSVEELAGALPGEAMPPANENRIRLEKFWFLTVFFLFLFLATFAAALMMLAKGYDKLSILPVLLLSCGFMLAGLIPVVIAILRYVYQDCRERGIKPAFWVIASATAGGLLYYLLRRDHFSKRPERR